ncbi:hypothetical protein M409DRAFT_17914 [Zasmidium cellare ATCC 36951]|uniref:Uncharacterized protein n=1 Tax=Zasmidium cellare ATCC 36951 TaxID=1080233 RepID=A0A6A6CWU4_ZASCE|nr:uncharacterized protein M409DRAFT_17914 [Zasmidium cellare ATCC 36951]KAF2171677.1 hypothetical protein M409DRAFT_17914 [Zasmidium cellare ATCC 36951]
MSRLAEIEAEEELTHKQLKLLEHLAKLDREKRSLRHAQRVDDDDEDNMDNKVKLEQLEREDTADGEDESQEGMQNNDDDVRLDPPSQSEYQLNQTRPQRRGETSRREPTASFHQLHYARGQLERGDRSYVQNRVGHQQQDTNPQRDFEAGNHQARMGDFPTPGPLQRTMQQWAQGVQGHDSTYGSMQENQLARDESIASTGMITPQPSERQAWSPPNYQQHLFQQVLPPSQVQPTEEAHLVQPQQAFGVLQGGGHVVQPQPIRTAGQDGPGPSLPDVATPQASRSSAQYDHHPVLSTLILLPNGQGYRELRCFVCKGNISKTVQLRDKAQTHKGKPSKGKTPDSKVDEPRFFSGIRGFQGHIRFCHPAELDGNGTITPADIFEKCKHRDLSHQEVIALVHPRRGYKGYKIEAVPGASAHEDSTVKQSRQRGGKTKVGSPSTKAQMAGKSSKKRKTPLASGGKPIVKSNSRSEESEIPVKTKRKRRSEALDFDSRQKQRNRKSCVLDDESEESESDSEDQPLRTVTETRKKRKAIMEGSVGETERDSTMREADNMLAALRDTFGGEEPNPAGSEIGAGEGKDED